MGYISILSFDMRILLMDLRCLRKSRHLLMHRLGYEYPRIFRPQFQQKRTAVLHHGNKLLIADPCRIKKDVIAEMSNPIYNLTSIINTAIISPQLDNCQANRAFHFRFLRTLFRNQAADILFIKAMLQNTADRTIWISSRFQINRCCARLHQGPLRNRFMIISIVKNYISGSKNRI